MNEEGKEDGVGGGKREASVLKENNPDCGEQAK